MSPIKTHRLLLRGAHTDRYRVWFGRPVMDLIADKLIKRVCGSINQTGPEQGRLLGGKIGKENLQDHSSFTHNTILSVIGVQMKAFTIHFNCPCPSLTGLTAAVVGRQSNNRGSDVKEPPIVSAVDNL